MTDQLTPNGTPTRHKHAAALAAGAKALREQAKPLAFEANLWERGLGDHYMRRASVTRKKLLRYADALEGLAGRRKAARTGA